MAVEQGRAGADAVELRPFVEVGAQALRVDEVELVGLIHGRLELVRLEVGGEVDEGAGGGGDWDSLKVEDLRNICR